MFAMKSMNICNDQVNYDEIIIHRSLVCKYMFYIFLFVGFLRRTSNYPKRISLPDLTHMMSMVDPVAIGVETPRIDSGCSLEKEFTELIRLNPDKSIKSSYKHLGVAFI